MREPDVLKRLRVYNESRARMGARVRLICADTLCVDAAKEIATLRADAERRVKEVAHLKLSAEIAERERMRGRDRDGDDGWVM